MKKFTIDASGIAIKPAEAAKAVCETFQAAYGDRGSDETPEDHLARKVEEYILNIYVSRQSEDSAQAVRTQTHADILDAATIRQRKDLAAEPEPQPATKPKQKG